MMLSDIIRSCLLKACLEQNVENEVITSVVDKFSDLEKDISEIETICQKINLPKGTYLLQENEYINTLWFIKKGIVRSYLSTAIEEQTMNLFFEDEFIDVYSYCVLHMPSKVNVEVLSDAELYAIDREKLNSLAEKYLLLFDIERIIICFIINSYNHRTIQLQQMSATDRYRHLLKLHPDILKSVRVSYIASYLGVSKERLSRIRKTLK